MRAKSLYSGTEGGIHVGARRLVVMAAIASMLAGSVGFAGFAGPIEVASAAGAGVVPNGGSAAAVASRDGRFVAFSSAASNLVAGDSNGVWDAFLWDRTAKTLEIVSVSSGGVIGNGDSLVGSITPDGRYVAFASSATNLVGGGNNDSTKIFVHDNLLDSTVLASVSTEGVEGDFHSWNPHLSDDGRLVSFDSFAGNIVLDDPNVAGDAGVYVRDLVAGTTIKASAQPGPAARTCGRDSWLAGNGRYVAFDACGTSLVPRDANGSAADVVVKDLLTGTITLESVSSFAVQADRASLSPSISADGRYVAFHSYATNLSALDVNGSENVYVRDRFSGTTTMESVSSLGVPGDRESRLAVISPDGRYLAFTSVANTLAPGVGSPPSTWWWRLYLRDLASGITTNVGVAAADVINVDVSAAPDVQTYGRAYDPHYRITFEGRFLTFDARETYAAGPRLRTYLLDRGPR